MTIWKTAPGVIAVAFCLTGVTTTADAGGFAIREQSTYYQGMSFAGSATGTGSASSLFWNPSAATQFPGQHLELHFAGILPQSTIDVTRADTPFFTSVPVSGPMSSGEIGSFALVPSSYAVLQVTDDLFLSGNFNAPFGLATNPEDTFAGRYHGTFSQLRTYAADLSASYRAHPMLSVGAGLTLMYAEARLDSTAASTNAQNPALPAGVLGVADTELTGHDWGIGFTLGATVMPTASTTIGVGFRSAVDLSLDGQVQTSNSVALAGGLVAAGPLPNRSFGATADLTLPEVVTLSISQRVTDALTIMGTVEWTNWSRFDELRVVNDSGVTTQLVEENWDDGWFFALGGEYRVNDYWTVRGGGAYEISPVPDAYRTPNIPDADRIWASIGASFMASDWLSIDAAYTHIFVEDGPIDRENANDAFGDGGRLLAEATDQSVDILSVSARIKFGGTPLFAHRAAEEGMVYKN